MRWLGLPRQLEQLPNELADSALRSWLTGVCACMHVHVSCCRATVRILVKALGTVAR
jgi:hypothetical protein